MWGGMMFQLYHRFKYTLGAILFLAGLAGDCMDGILLLTRGEWLLLLWHIPFALAWAAGVNIITSRDKQGQASFRTFLNKWGATALLLGTGTFPGLGTCAYSIALVIARYLFSQLIIPGSTPSTSE